MCVTGPSRPKFRPPDDDSYAAKIGKKTALHAWASDPWMGCESVRWVGNAEAKYSWCDGWQAGRLVG